MKRIALISLCIFSFSGCSQEPQSVEELQKAGERAFVNQDYAAAREYFLKAVTSRPSDRDLLYLLGVSYQRDYLFDSAFHYLKRADLLYPDDREINLELYKVARELEEWKSTIQALHVLIKTGNPIEQYYTVLADLNYNIENREVAYYFYRKALEKEPDNRNHYLAVANLAADLDSLDIALAVIDSAIERFGSSGDFLTNRGMYLVAMRRFQESEGIFRSLIAGDSSMVIYKLNLANVLASQDDRSKKHEAYQLYLELQPLVGGEMRVDSMVGALEEELRIEK